MAQFLYEKLSLLEELDELVPLPLYIADNLAEHIKLREYQERGLRYFLTYLAHDKLRPDHSVQALFHMATGSGKTVMMAALILYLYKLGYRRFVFFVNQTTILEKTRANFLDHGSNKYLFAQTVNIDGKTVPIREINNFAKINDEAINIRFTSIQKLHYDLMFPSENGLSIEDFQDNKVALISDEAHHVNSLTKKNLTKGEEDAIRTWEYSVMNAFNQNDSNILLEFTATANLNNAKVQDKYSDLVVFDYPLAKFRESGFTKDFQNLQADLPAWERSLIALVMSEYRRALATGIRQNIKPVVLLKSSRVADSQSFYSEFFTKLAALTPEELTQLDSGEGLYHDALMHFRATDETLGHLVLALQLGFSSDKALIVNSRSEAERAQTQLALNSLEDDENPYRLIFAVDMLNEGWDVLNLYDIVRLYETRKGKSYTIKEAQLIGRAARYYPFVANEEQDRFTRKYDNDLSNPYRLLETMYFHSVQDSKYITELRAALKDTGLLEPESYTVTYRIKKEFKKTPFWHNGLIFANQKVEKNPEIVTSLPQRFRTNKVTVRARNFEHNVHDLFEGSRSENVGNTQVRSKRFRNLPYNLLLGTVEESLAFGFNILKRKFPNLSSIDEFLTSDMFLGDVTIDVICPEAVEPAPRDWQNGVRKVVAQMEGYLTHAEKQYIGTTTFEGRKLNAVLKDKTMKFTRRDLDGIGTSQKFAENDDIRLNLEDKPWYVFNDNYGTTEEKRLIRYIAGMMETLENKYSEVYLIRNEGFPELAIFID